MSSFAEVVKQLKENKVSQDDGFVRVESALGVTGAKSLQEEKAKKEANIKDKELTYLQKMGEEVGLLNKNFKSLAKELKTPEGITGGLLGLLVSPIYIIAGFFESVIKQFLAIQKMLMPKTFKTISNFFKNIGAGFNKLDKLTGKPLGIFDFKTLSGKIGAVFRTITDTISKPFIAIGNFFKNNKFVKSVGKILGSISQTVKDLVGIIENAFGGGDTGKGGKVNKVFTTVKEVFEKVLRVSLALGRLFGKFLAPIFIAYDAFVATFITENRGIFERIVKGLGAGFGSFVNIFITSILDLIKSSISWIAGALGFKKFEATLDSFSFTEIFNKFMFVVEELIIGVKDYFTTNLSWKNILDKSGVSDILNDFLEFIKPVTDFVDDVKKWFVSLIDWDKAVAMIKTGIFNMAVLIEDLNVKIKQYFKDLFKFEEGSTASIVKKFFGDALDKLGNVFSKLLDSLIKLARNILPESAQKLLGIEMTDGEKKLKKQIETQEKINELEKRISLEQTKINKSLFGEKQYGLTGETTGIRGSNTRITRAQENINALKLDLNPIQNTIETVKKEVVPVVNRFDNQFEARANEIKQAELQKLAFGNSPNMNVVSSVDNSSIITNNGGGGSPIIASVNPDTVISRATSYAT